MLLKALKALRGGGPRNMRQFIHTYNNIITVEKLLKAWQEFLRDKKKRSDVILFQAKLIDNIFDLYNDLKNRTYKHGGYKAFNISDPKPRRIHKATVRDRLFHHLIYQELYDYFDNKFIYDSYSCRKNKGTHKAIYRFENFIRKASKNNNKTCWILKCDIKKFFASINHGILKDILAKHIQDKNILWLLGQIIDSFNANAHLRYSVDVQNNTNSVMTENVSFKGLPLGNLTSQLLVNIYMNEFDQFAKRRLKVKYYIRYADDFVILSGNKEYLKNILEQIKEFLENNLKLNLHPDKVFIKTIVSGVDFLGWVHFPKHRVLRTSTKRKMIKNLKNCKKLETVNSYIGLLKHGNTYKIKKSLKML